VTVVECRACHGTGDVEAGRDPDGAPIGYECPVCNGEGTTTEDRDVTLATWEALQDRGYA
jgi:DnaJ-class molecular chaperone